MATEAEREITRNEWERWRGTVDEWRQGSDKHMTATDVKVEALDKRQDEFDKELARVTTKIGFAAGIGAIGGGAIITLILTLATKAFGG